MAFQTYAGLLGVRLPGAALTTSDVDIAQFHSVSVSVGDELPLIEPLLKEIDGSFRPVPHISGHAGSTAFINAAGFKVEFLTLNRGKAEPGEDRKSVVLGKSVSVRVDLGCRRIIKTTMDRDTTERNIRIPT